MLRTSFPAPANNYYFKFKSAQEAREFSQQLLAMGIGSLANPQLAKNPVLMNDIHTIVLSEYEHQLYEAIVTGTNLDCFPENIRKAVRWAQHEIFRHPYPFLTPWIDQSQPAKLGLCPKQLMHFETELDCGQGRKVVRPNHGMVHSIRVCKYMAYVCNLFKKYSTDQELQAIVNDPKEVEILQTMMLFSVSGRVNEAGRAGWEQMNEAERELSQRNYEESRHYSAENFKRYCQETGFVDVTSEKFNIYYHAMRYMERRGDKKHNWNPYIKLMSLTHSMDLMRCFPPAWMNNLHLSFEAQFSDHPQMQQNPAKVRADIFRVLKEIENSQRLTGNRVTTGIDATNQSYYPCGMYYNHDLFHYCTENVDWTMDQLCKPYPYYKSFTIFPQAVGSAVYSADTQLLFFANADDAVKFSNFLYQEGISPEIKRYFNTGYKGYTVAGVSLSNDEFRNALRFTKINELQPAPGYAQPVAHQAHSPLAQRQPRMAANSAASAAAPRNRDRDQAESAKEGTVTRLISFFGKK